MRKVISGIALAAFLLCNNAALYAGGLSSHFVEVKLQDLEPGRVYSVKEETGRNLVVKNTTDKKTVDIAIKPELPVGYNLVKGYEPIPDSSWIQIEKSYFKDVGPGESAVTDIKITIPKGNKHRGKKYQVYIYSHTAGKAAMQVGLMGRLLIHTKK